MSQYTSLALIGASLALAPPAYAGESRLIAGRRTWKRGITMQNRVILIACVLAGFLWAPYVTAKERGAQEERAAQIVASHCVIHTTQDGYLKKVAKMDADDVWISNLTNGEGGWIQIGYAFAGWSFNTYYNVNSREAFCGSDWKSLGRKFHKAPGNVDFFASTGSTFDTSSDSWTRFQGYDDGMLCRAALTGGGTRWETRRTWLPAVEEAQQKGFSVEDCRNIGGL